MFQPAMSVPQKLVQARQYPVHASPNAFRPATYPDIMTTLEMLIDVLSRSRERFDRAFDGVTLEQANTQPAPDLAPRIDSLTWLAWHAAREIDLQISLMAGQEFVWFTGGHPGRPPSGLVCNSGTAALRGIISCRGHPGTEPASGRPYDNG